MSGCSHDHRSFVGTPQMEDDEGLPRAGGLVLSIVTPRQVLKEAFAAKLLDDGQVWIDMLSHRNILSHTYNPASFDKALAAIHERYVSALTQLHDRLQHEVSA